MARKGKDIIGSGMSFSAKKIGAVFCSFRVGVSIINS